MKVQELGIEADLKENVQRGGLHLKFWGDKQLKLRALNPNKEVMGRLSNDHWAFSYNLKTKDVECEYRAQVKPGELTIRQRIPNARWELFPTPEIKMAFNPRLFGKGKVEHKAAISYDLLNSRGRLEQSLDFNKRVKVKLNADSNIGPNGSLIFNLDKPWAKSAGVEYSKKMGPVLTYHAEPSKQLLFDSAFVLQRRELFASIQLAPTKNSKIKFTAEATASSSALSKPKTLRLGARYTI